MAAAGIIFLVVFIAGLAFLIYMSLNSQNPREGYVGRLKLYHNLRTGYKCKIDTDYNNPEDFLKRDANNPTLVFINREKKGLFDNGDKRVNISANYWIRQYEGYTQILDEVDIINKELILKLQRKDNELKTMVNLNAELISQNNHLTNKKDLLVRKDVELMEKMNEASRKGIPLMKRPGQQR